jgi:hypothetical protein
MPAKADIRLLWLQRVRAASILDRTSGPEAGPQGKKTTAALLKPSLSDLQLALAVVEC